ncbi:MAG: hypothetical protein ACLFN5_05980 [bacterium]
MLPLLSFKLIDSIKLLSRGADNFADRCISGLKVNEERCRQLVERNLSLATALAPEIGYDRAAKVAKKALAEDKTVREVVVEENLVGTEKLDKLLDPLNLTEPGFPG